MWEKPLLPEGAKRGFQKGISFLQRGLPPGVFPGLPVLGRTNKGGNPKKKGGTPGGPPVRTNPQPEEKKPCVVKQGRARVKKGPPLAKTLGGFPTWGENFLG